MPIDQHELERRFAFVLSNDDNLAKHRYIREDALGFAESIIQVTPESREQSLAITALEEAVMWANAAIARNPIPVEVPC